MKKLIFISKFFIFYLFFSSITLGAQNSFFEKGKMLFEKNEFDKSKVFFEKDIVFNPKSEKSYLFLAKIHNSNKNIELEEINLKNVINLNPKNDEAIYMLTLIKIEQFNYSEAKDLIEKFDLVCDTFCSKKEEVKLKFNKLVPEDE